MRTNTGQGSLEYLLLLSGVILVGVIVFIMAQQTIGEGKSILETNLGQSTQATSAAVDNFTTPLTSVTLTVEGGDGKVIITYSAPGANQFLLVQEKDSSGTGPTVVDQLNTPESFDSVPINPDVKLFGLPFYDNVAESGGVENGKTYHYRLRACNNEGTCLVNTNVESATPVATTG